jgi:hypothetical protein
MAQRSRDCAETPAGLKLALESVQTLLAGLDFPQARDLEGSISLKACCGASLCCAVGLGAAFGAAPRRCRQSVRALAAQRGGRGATRPR